MNWQTAEGKWEQIKGKAQQKWGKLTKDDIDRAKGRRTELIGRLRERYGMEQDEAERQVDDWMKKI